MISHKYRNTARNLGNTLAVVAAALLFALVFHDSARATEPAPPSCTGDCWNGKDKVLHFGVSYAVGFAAGHQWPNNKPLAFGVALIPGLVKEISDSSSGGTGFSGKDMAANALGAGLGVFTAHWLIKRQNGGVLIGYKAKMNVF